MIERHLLPHAIPCIFSTFRTKQIEKTTFYGYNSHRVKYGLYVVGDIQSVFASRTANASGFFLMSNDINSIHHTCSGMQASKTTACIDFSRVHQSYTRINFYYNFRVIELIITITTIRISD